MATKSGAGVHGAQVDYWRLKRTVWRAKKELPGDWLHSIAVEAEKLVLVPYIAPMPGDIAYRRAQQRRYEPKAIEVSPGNLSRREVWAKWLDEYGGAAYVDLSDADIKTKAAEYANEAETLDIGRLEPGQVSGAWAEYARLLGFCNTRGVDAPTVRLLLAGMGARVRCKYWWRRALRKMVARRCERGAMALGLVCKQRGQSYASNKAVFRRIDQNKRNKEAMENTALENEDGQRATLAELAARSVSNKAIRRGELMTRIRGCEEIADELGMVGVFLTLTCPSRFHTTKHTGERNKKHDGSSPKDAQKWLCTMWQRARAKLQRKGLNLFGFRVAEPHHDGCPHWHALLWAKDGAAIDAAIEIVRDYWLSDDGDERGADKYRVNSKRMEKGGAAGYIAKYIAKNIDDAGIDSHIDDYADGPIGTDMLGDVEVKPCMRVEAWASTWGIRQFQAIGQPPVTVWRELRRVAASNAENAGKGGAIHRAWKASQGSGVGMVANWSAYCKAQGGVMQGRAYVVALATETRDIKGRYETAQRKCVMGVRINTPGSRCTFSERRLWRVVDSASSGLGFATAKLTPRTRVNNCTHNRLRSHAVVSSQVQLRDMGAMHTEPLTDYQRILAAVRRSGANKNANSC
jgi:Bacteriophage replication gene A protein (GPA)